MIGQRQLDQDRRRCASSSFSSATTRSSSSSAISPAASGRPTECPPLLQPRACAGGRSTRPGRRRPEPSRARSSPSSFDLLGDLGADPCGERRALHQRRRHRGEENSSYGNGRSTSLTSRPSDSARRTPISMSSLQPLDVARAHRVADEGALLRPPEGMLDEDRQEPVRSLDEVALRLLVGVLKQHLLVRHAGPVMDAVVGRQPVAEVLEHGPARGASDQPEARDDQALVEDLHLEDLLLERVRLERHVRELVQVRVALRGAACLLDQLQPGLGVARLVLHHRRVVELRLRIGRDVQQLRRHLAGEHVGLELLREHGTPHVLAPCLPLG